MKNPSLRQEPRYAPASVIALEQTTSLLEWLEDNGRIIYREKKEEDLIDEMVDDQELSELMDDDGFEEDDDDSDDLD